MGKKHCEYCNDGNEPVAYYVFADDEDFELRWAEYCPICGRHLE